MASIELSPLSEHFDDKDVHALESALAEIDSSPLDIDDHAEIVVVGNLDGDVLAELLDRLDDDAAAEIYVPPEFEDVLDIAGTRVGSAHTLLAALQELRDAIGFDSDDDEDIDAVVMEDVDGEDIEEEHEDEDEDAFDMKEGELKHIWTLMHRGAKTCIRQGVCMFIRK